MGFFDTIDRLKSTETELQPAIITDQDSRENEKKRQTGPFQVKKKTNSKPERLSFLRTCPLCNGKKFIYGNDGGFFCLVCQPGIMGTPVEAGGADRQQPDHEAVLQVVPRENKQNTQRGSRLPETVKDTATKQERGHFAAAWPWIRSKLPELLAAGWTRAALFQRSKYRYPLGWGIAWFSIWNQDALVVTTGKNGEIIFTFQSCGRTITQTARPPIKKNKPGTRNEKNCQ